MSPAHWCVAAFGLFALGRGGGEPALPPTDLPAASTEPPEHRMGGPLCYGNAVPSL